MSANHEKVQVPNDQIEKPQRLNPKILLGIIVLILSCIIGGLFFRKRLAKWNNADEKQPVIENNNNISNNNKENISQVAGNNISNSAIKIQNDEELYDPELLLLYYPQKPEIPISFCVGDKEYTSKIEITHDVLNIINNYGHHTKYKMLLSYNPNKNNKNACLYWYNDIEIHGVVYVLMSKFVELEDCPKEKQSDIFAGKKLYDEGRQKHIILCGEKFFHITNFKIL